MSKQKTYLTEISLAKGLNNEPFEQVIHSVQGVSKSQNDFFNVALKENVELARIFNHIGKSLRHAIEPVSLVEWTGQIKIKDENKIASQDILVNQNIVISVKENSHVLVNGSPAKIFIFLPKGIINRYKKNKISWFDLMAFDEIKSYFETCAELLNYLPKNYEEFLKTKRATQKDFGKQVRNLHEQGNQAVLSAYKKLCEQVSKKSAESFNLERANQSLEQSNYIIFKELFRVDDYAYILAGTEDRKPFACQIPSFKDWQKSFAIDSLTVSPVFSGQPEVLFTFIFKNLETSKIFSLSIKAEIRWSHGKFCGCPESKMYKQWSYADLPWVKKITITD